MTRFPNPESNVRMVGRIRFLSRIGVVCSLLLVLSLRGCVGQQQQQQEDPQKKIQRLHDAWMKNPRDAANRFELGWATVQSTGTSVNALQLLASAFNAQEVDVPLFLLDNWINTYLAAHLVGRWRQEEKDQPMAALYTDMAYEVSKKNSPSKEVGETCTHMQLATMLETYPLSKDAADQSLAKMEKWASHLIEMKTKNHPDVVLNRRWLFHTMPGFPNDPYVHCVYNLFPLSFYYRADVAKIANLQYRVGSLFFPELLYVAQHVKEFEEEQEEERELVKTLGSAPEDGGNDAVGSSSTPLIQTCVDRKIKIGVLCSTISKHHSVAEDFGGVLQRLDRDVFDISYHYIHEKSIEGDEDDFVRANPSDRLFHYRLSQEDRFNPEGLTSRLSKELEKFEFDMVYYLDLTMGTIVRRLGHGRLAPVQIVSHGHPVTSGIPRDTVQHFVSWAEAELPIEQSQKHYTEELQLIPKGKIHQYYTPRVQRFENGKMRTRITGQRFDQITRKDFSNLPDEIRNSGPDDEDIHLYVCMQKPFKLFPEFDELVCGVLRKDPHGHAILHDEDKPHLTSVFSDRLKAAGCDMDRVHFLPSQESHRLMALYKTATVILDSYPAGGCTTTREVLELGKAIVTWPARLLGGRWTLGYYNIMGLDDESKARVIADSKKDYIAKAVELGTNKALRQDVEANILEAMPNLFFREDAVEEWEKIFLRISPVKQCKGTDESAQRFPDKDEL